MKKWILGVTMSAACVSAGVFDAGTTSVGVTVGSGTGFNNTYTIVGVGANYFVENGLSLGLGYRGWFGATPTMNEIDVPVTYYVPLQSKVRPYVGAFYRHTFISGDYSDYDTYGARAGLAYVEGRGYISAGWVQEWYSNDNGDNASRGYPEIAAGISF